MPRAIKNPSLEIAGASIFPGQDQRTTATSAALDQLVGGLGLERLKGQNQLANTNASAEHQRLAAMAAFFNKNQIRSDDPNRAVLSDARRVQDNTILVSGAKDAARRERGIRTTLPDNPTFANINLLSNPITRGTTGRMDAAKAALPVVAEASTSVRAQAPNKIDPATGFMVPGDITTTVDKRREKLPSGGSPKLPVGKGAKQKQVFTLEAMKTARERVMDKYPDTDASTIEFFDNGDIKFKNNAGKPFTIPNGIKVGR
jgi:hypothetical protein